MGQIPQGKWGGDKKGPGTHDITGGKMTSGGGKLGAGKKLKAMMVWKDTGKKGAY